MSKAARIQRDNSPFLVLDFRFYIINCVRRLHLESDSLSREGLDEYLHLV